jgi:hypothetical protein
MPTPSLQLCKRSSELTCQNPKSEHGPEHEDGFIGFPIVSDRMKLVTVGVCEWTVTQVKEQRISEHAKLKGNTNVVCTFTEEAERHCKGGQVRAAHTAAAAIQQAVRQSVKQADPRGQAKHLHCAALLAAAILPAHAYVICSTRC